MDTLDTLPNRVQCAASHGQALARGNDESVRLPISAVYDHIQQVQRIEKALQNTKDKQNDSDVMRKLKTVMYAICTISDSSDDPNNLVKMTDDQLFLWVTRRMRHNPMLGPHSL